MKDKRGFSIVELMVVVAILGILCAIAYPIYSQYLLSGQRSEATATLQQLRALEEEYRSLNGNYGPVGTYTGTANIQTQGGNPFLSDFQAPNGGNSIYNYCVTVSNGGLNFTVGAIPGASAPPDAVVDAGTGAVATLDHNNAHQGANFW